MNIEYWHGVTALWRLFCNREIFVHRKNCKKTDIFRSICSSCDWLGFMHRDSDYFWDSVRLSPYGELRPNRKQKWRKSCDWSDNYDIHLEFFFVSDCSRCGDQPFCGRLQGPGFSNPGAKFVLSSVKLYIMQKKVRHKGWTKG